MLAVMAKNNPLEKQRVLSSSPARQPRTSPLPPSPDRTPALEKSVQEHYPWDAKTKALREIKRSLQRLFLGLVAPSKSA